jgi:hypothetical protein
MKFFLPAIMVLLTCFQPVQLQAQLSVFLYQGTLTDGGSPANGQYDILLTAHDALTGGNQVGGSSSEYLGLEVVNGKFVMEMAFGANWLDGNNRWIETKVRRSAVPTTEPYVTLTPRQRIYPTPMAELAAKALTVPAAAIGTGHIADRAVTGNKIALGSIGGVLLLPGGVGRTALATDAVGADNLEAGSVTTAKLASGAVGTMQLADQGVTGAKLALGIVGGAHLTNQAVTTIALADSAVTGPKLADSAVTGAKLADSSVTGAKLAAGSVGGTALAGGSVDASKLADGAITSAKLAPAVAASLGTPMGALIGSFEENAAALMSSGYARIPGLTSTVGGWNQIQERNSQTNAYTTMEGFASLWTGSELFIYGRENFSFQMRATRLNPATGLWNPVPTNVAPQFMSNTRLSMVQGGTNVFAFGNVDTFNDNTNSTGGYFNLATGTWQNIPTNGFTRIYDDGAAMAAHFFWTGDEVLAVGSPNFGFFDGALFSPATNGWRQINTNGHPSVFMDSGVVGWNGSELLVYGASQTNFGGMAGALYNPASSTWRPASTNNGPRFNGGPTRNRVIWTGTEWIGYFTSATPTVPSTFHAYNPQTDSWRRCSTNGMPNLFAPGSAVPNYFWTGTEVGMVMQIGATTRRTAVYLYQPATDTWRSFLSAEPAIVTGITDYTRVITPQWTGTEVLSYLPVSPDDGTPVTVFRSYRFAPQRTLYIYQRN